MTGPAAGAGLRVAYVCTDPGIDVFGAKGAAVHVQAVLRALLRRGAHVDLIAARAGRARPADLAAVSVHLLPSRPPREDDDRATAPPAASPRGAVADAGVAALLDRVRREQGLDLVYERYALWGRSAMRWARRRGVRSVLEVNAPLPLEAAEHRGLLDVAGAERIAHDAIGAAGAVVAVSDEVAAWARRHTARGERVLTVANGVDTRAVAPARRAVHDGGCAPFTIGFVGSLKPWHGTHHLVDALALLRAGAGRSGADHRLLIVGDGPCADDLRARAAAAGLGDAVELTGALEAARVPAQLHRMDVACAPYPPLERFYFSPLKVAEYLAAGLPVVASDIGVLPALLDHGALGELVAPGDPVALAAAIERLRTDPARRTRLRTAARAAVERHSWEHVLDRTLAHAGLPAGGVDHAA